MDKHLSSYVKKYKMLDKSTCDVILKELDNVEFTPHHFVDYNGEYIPDLGDPFLYNSQDGKLSKETYTTIMEAYFTCLHKYVNELNFPWYSNWHGYTPPKFNLYTEQTFMKNHCDHIDSIFTGEVKGIPVLSMIATINDGFQGGDFYVFDDENFTASKGEVVIFPSNFLFPHKVQPVTQGKRISMVSWVF